MHVSFYLPSIKYKVNMRGHHINSKVQCSARKYNQEGYREQSNYFHLEVGGKNRPGAHQKKAQP